MKVKEILYFLPLSISVFSCTADEVTVNKMADEMCRAMTKYDEEKPKSVFEAGSLMLDIISKGNEYGNVTEDQLNKAMMEKCPEGYRKFVLLSDKSNR